MLVLSRKPGEKVRIGSSIAFVVLDIRGGRVRIGIDAPAEVSILRQELCAGPGEPFLHPPSNTSDHVTGELQPST